MFTRKLCIVSTRALIAENALVIVAIEKITPLLVFFSLRFFRKISFCSSFLVHAIGKNLNIVSLKRAILDV